MFNQKAKASANLHERSLRPRIGGQAVMEGVMMNGEHNYTLAVRRQDGTITSHIYEHESITTRKKGLNIPVIRGVIRFVESLIIGMKTLNISADYYIEEEETEDLTEKEKQNRKRKDNAMTAVTMVVAVVLAVAVFVALPVVISKLFSVYVLHNQYVLGLLEGLIRMILFIAYLLLISHIKDIQRTFEYHGAEHKTINCFEAELPLTVENVKKQSRFNKRCGTSFLFIIMLMSILIFSFIQIQAPLPRFFIHLAMIPVIAGLSYELLKLSARSENKLLNALVKPGLWFQKITTKEPDDKEMEVAITSVIKLMEREHPEFLS